MSIADNVAHVREQLARAAEAAGRNPAHVRLIAVSKRQPIDRILQAHDAGVRDFGDNTVQGLCEAAAVLQREGREVRWHFIGHLQRNKINRLLPHVHVLHTLDREALAHSIAKRIETKTVDSLVQVNVGNEPQKSGVSIAEAVDFAKTVAAMPGVRLRGVMGMPPYGVDPRPYFEILADLSRQLVDDPQTSIASEISMGMSDDFETAIACGATMVRVGTAVFGERTS